MKRVMLIFALLALLIGNYAYATTYTYTGAYFTDGIGNDYSEGMRVTGTINTSSPIPPNSVDFDISGIVTSWSFNDGVNTISTPDSVLFPLFTPAFSTDTEGNIIEGTWVVMNTPVATLVGEVNDLIGIDGNISVGYNDLVCSEVTDGFCTEWDEPISAGIAEAPGVWESDLPPPSAIPTLSQWSLMLLALMLGLVGIARVRRQV